MAYTREAPSARYLEMMALYRQLHREGEPQRSLTAAETYPGVSLLPHVVRIKELIGRTGARTILDYGCGKGMQYELTDLEVPGAGRCASIVDYWDVDRIDCYDPCHPPHSTLPAELSDGVISTDVLEHCTAEDLPWIVAEMFGYARRFVYACVACYPARTHLPDGQNAHITVQPIAWWESLFEATGRRHPDILWTLVAQTPQAGDDH